MLRFALNSIESVVRRSIYISIISSDMQNSYYGFCGTFFKSAFGANMFAFTQETAPKSAQECRNLSENLRNRKSIKFYIKALLRFFFRDQKIFFSWS